LPVISPVVADPQQPDQDPEAAAPSECLPCRGTGTVVSFLGGEGSNVPCPWCEGTGTRKPGIDAQARWLADGEPDTAADAEAEPSGATAA
jgi:hypothetical protein